MNDHRPDPDLLLKRLTDDESERRGGRLKVFLGMCPGVGKTFAMLEAAQERRRAGQPVLVGLVETHGREETEALLAGLETLPRRCIEHRGILLQELDLDGVLQRRPPLVLIDELAHTNAPGSRHARRWQDVEELLQAGIDVYTALNVQHIDSLNDAVAQVTTIRVRETVPDSMLESADEIVVVDLPPEELLSRLAQGKVYLGEAADRAREGFFKRESLVALRELALRYVAERVGAKVRVARLRAGASAIWPTQERLLVGVGPSPSSARLIRSTRRLAGVLGASWVAVSVETPATLRLPLAARERIAEHLRLAERLGAEVITVSGIRISESLLREARTQNVTKVVVGKPVVSRWREFLRPSPVDELVRASGDIDVYVIRGDDSETRKATEASPAGTAKPAGARPYLVAVASVLGSSLIAEAMSLEPNLFGTTDLAMVYVIGVALAALEGSWRASILACVLAVNSLNFLFLPPKYTFTIESPRYVTTFLLLFCVSLVVSWLSIRVREQRDLARRGEDRAEALRRFTERISAARGVRDLALVVAEEVTRVTAMRALLFLPRTGAPMEMIAAGSPQNSLLDPEKERAVAQWTHDHRQPAGRGTQTLSSGRFLHLPLVSGDACLGVLAVELPERQALAVVEQREFLDAIARQAALALGVERLAEERRLAQLEAENERLRSSILSAVSHDLRTPLASIIGSASGLIENADSFSTQVRRDLLEDILEESERLNRLVTNLLEISRMEGGGVGLRRAPVLIADVLSTAQRAMRRRLQSHPLHLTIAPDLPLADADEVLLHLVIVNLLDNAAKFSPPEQPITIDARQDGEWICIAVEDLGPGFAREEMERVFEKFYRGATSSATRGAGLGLAICRGIVLAHGGSIRAENREGGGARVSFTVPVAHLEIPLEEAQ